VAKKPSSKKPKSKGTPLAQRLAHDPALVKKYQSNPGLRAKYLTGALEKYLTPAQKQTRQTNARLNQPIAPGSKTTERDLAHEAQAAVGVRYGPQDRALGQQLGVAMQTERDTGSLYDQYQQALQQHAAAVQAYQAGAQNALAGTAAGITGLGQQAAVGMAQAAAPTQSAVAGPSADMATLANQALAVRQGVMGTFQGQQALQGSAANTYADALANVVAPGQKLGALAQARGRTRDIQKNVADLATEKGAFDQQFRSERRQDEFKNQLAMQTLGLNQQKAAVDAAATQARVTQSSPEGVAATSGARAAASTAAKYGYTAHQWAMLGPTRRAQIIKDAKKTTGRGGTDTVYTSGAFAGRKKSDIANMTDAQRQKIVQDYNAGKGSGGSGAAAATDKKAFRQKYGVDLQTTTAHNKTRDAIQNAQTAFGQVGKVTTRRDGSKKRVTTDEVVSVLRNQHVSNVFIRAALDITRYGHITPGTAARLHKAGYSVGTLGFQTGAPTRRGSRSGSNIPAGKV